MNSTVAKPNHYVYCKLVLIWGISDRDDGWMTSSAKALAFPEQKKKKMQVLFNLNFKKYISY